MSLPPELAPGVSQRWKASCKFRRPCGVLAKLKITSHALRKLSAHQSLGRPPSFLQSYVSPSAKKLGFTAGIWPSNETMGALAAMQPSTNCGNLVRNHVHNIPPYEPPNPITGDA
eukprot:1353361-Amorphochlora_amoeboformis.AAC.2